MEFSKKLKKLRLEKGISQQKLADLIYVSRSAVAKWENGLGFPSEESYDALAELFGVSKDFFKMDNPEQIIVEKNKRIKKSPLLCALLSSLLFAAQLSSPVSIRRTQRQLCTN